MGMSTIILGRSVSQASMGEEGKLILKKGKFFYMQVLGNERRVEYWEDLHP
jgi:hypothetical protein